VSALVAAAVLVAGCGEEASPREPAADPASREPTADPAVQPTRLPRAHCPAALAGCRTATGRILYVERVDPDGDGDAHFVLASGEAITAPGVSVIDVRRDLRPHPLPGPGDRLSAAGLVQRGSYGQRQIEAVRVRVAR
jgi:hypothetical protein